MPKSTSQNFCCQCPCPQGEPQPHPTSAGDPPTLAVEYNKDLRKSVRILKYIKPEYNMKIIIKYCRGQTAKARRTTILQPVEQKPHSQKDRQDEKAEGYVPDEGTR